MTQYRRSGINVDFACIGASITLILAGLTGAQPALAQDTAPNPPAAQATEAQGLADAPPVVSKGNRIVDDHSGRKESGVASIYAHSFDGRTMADGKRYEPQNNVAASKTLPLGTVAKVTNLETGKSTEVRIEDRGPFVDGRVVDLTPHAASKIGLSRKEGLAPVIVAPVAVPQTDGSVKPGAGAATAVAGAP
jgi:rare lipoprotein A